MSFVICSTENARYILIPSHHANIALLPKTTLDALIVEASTRPVVDAVMRKTNDTVEEYQDETKLILQQAGRTNTPLFVTDAALNQHSLTRAKQGTDAEFYASLGITAVGGALIAKGALKKPTTRKQFLQKLGTIIGGGALTALPFLHKQKSHAEYLDTTPKNDYATLRAQTVLGPGLTTVREAITAEKAENFIAPLMQKRLGRRPVIGILFGADHIEQMKQLIENENRRKQIFRKFELPKYVYDYKNTYEIEISPKGKPQKLKVYENTLREEETQTTRIQKRPQTRRQFFSKLVRTNTRRRV